MKWLDDLAVKHRGLVVREDVLEVVSEAELRSLVRSKVLLPERPRVYRTVGTPRTWELGLIAVCLSVGDGCFPSHGSAARRHGLRYVPSGRYEVTAPRLVRLPGVKAYRSSLVLPS